MGGDGKSSWRAGRVQEALLESWEGSGGQEEDGSLYQRAGWGWESHQECWEGSGGFTVGPGRVGSPTQRSGNGWEALPEDRQE